LKDWGNTLNKALTVPIHVLKINRLNSKEKIFFTFILKHFGFTKSMKTLYISVENYKIL
jgi:hypothetical protein